MHANILQRANICASKNAIKCEQNNPRRCNEDKQTNANPTKTKEKI